MTQILIKPGQEGERIDSFLAKEHPEFSRTYFAKLAKNNGILINKKSVKPSYILAKDDIIDFDLVEMSDESEIKPEKIKLDVIYEDSNVIVINKQANLVVHPAAGNKTHTLVNALLDYYPSITDAVHEKDNLLSQARPGIVHRLDKDTSGVMIVAKNSRTLRSLSKQIQHRDVKKKYEAICYGWPKEESGTIVSYLGRHPKDRKKVFNIGKEKGKEAISDYKVLGYYQYGSAHISLIEFLIHTGRTHQIRVQSKDMGCPVLGDEFYGHKDSDKVSNQLKITRQLLHAKTLSISLPGAKKQSIFEAPRPKDFEETLQKITLTKDD